MPESTEQPEAKRQPKDNGRPAAPADGDCPLVKSTHKLQGLTKEMKELLKQVRKDMGACNHCSLKDGCQIRAEFGQLVKEALQEVAAELKLARY
jgi:hypothetical protein